MFSSLTLVISIMSVGFQVKGVLLGIFDSPSCSYGACILPCRGRKVNATPFLARRHFQGLTRGSTCARIRTDSIAYKKDAPAASTLRDPARMSDLTLALVSLPPPDQKGDLVCSDASLSL